MRTTIFMMRKNSIYLKFATLGLLSLLALAACDRTTRIGDVPDPGDGPGPGTGTTPVKTIVDLKARCTQNSVAITEDITLTGTVTGNDHYGEFYKTLVIQDASGGIMLSVDGTGLSDEFPIGAGVELHCNGLSLGRYGGKVQAGATPEPGGAYSVGRIASADLGRYLRRDKSRDGFAEPAVPTFDRIGTAHIDTFVCFEDVRFVEQGVGWCDIDPVSGEALDTQRQIEDSAGNRFFVRTESTCLYAKSLLPAGRGKVYGIVDYFNGEYALRVSSYMVDFELQQ